LKLRILKRRGGWATNVFTIDFDDKLNQATPDFSDMPIGHTALPEKDPPAVDCRSPMEFPGDPERLR
jgi:hypothetical protein